MKTKFVLFFLLSINAAGVTSIYCRNSDRELAPLELMIAVEENKYSVFSEGAQRSWLYRMALENPHFCKMNSFKKNKEYFILVLRDHIEKLEKKLAQKKTGITSWSIAKGSLSLGLAVLSGYVFYYLKKSKQQSADFNYNYWHQHQWEDMRMKTLVGSAISVLGLSAFSAIYFSKVWRYQQRIVERIQRDKELLALIENS